MPSRDRPLGTFPGSAGGAGRARLSAFFSQQKPFLPADVVPLPAATRQVVWWTAPQLRATAIRLPAQKQGVEIAGGWLASRPAASGTNYAGWAPDLALAREAAARTDYAGFNLNVPFAQCGVVKGLSPIPAQNET